MHIADGILPPSVLLAGAAAATGGIALGLKKMDTDDVPKAGVLASAIFVASLIHIPLGPTSIHPVMSGLTGLLLGWGAFPAFLAVLLLQAVLFGMGGVTSLGVNIVILAAPGVLCHYLFGRWTTGNTKSWTYMAGAAAGAVSILGAGLLAFGFLAAAGNEFVAIGAALAAACLPLAAIEAVLTGATVGFLAAVRPEVLVAMNGRTPQPAQEASY